MAVTGRPESIAAAADVLATTADRLDGFRADVGDPTVRTYADWHGTAAPIAAERLRGDLDVLTRAAQACRAAAPALRVYAEQLTRARRDAADGAAEPDVELGAHILQSAEDAAGLAAEDAARVVRDATALLPELVDTDGGIVLDGLRKAGGDLLDEVGTTLSGALDHVNPFSDRFGEAWSETSATVAAAVTDPAGALSTVVDGITAPVADSYRTGGVDEAAGRGFGTIAAALLGGKGVTKLAKLVPKAPPAPVGPLPAMRRVPGGGLRAHDNLGGHSLSEKKAHVGATDDQLRARLDREPRRQRVSSYTNRLVAERAVHDNVRGNGLEIQAWLRDPDQSKVGHFLWQHDGVVGRTATRGGEVLPASLSTVVLRRDPLSALGYYVLTTYPGE